MKFVFYVLATLVPRRSLLPLVCAKSGKERARTLSVTSQLTVESRPLPSRERHEIWLPITSAEREVKDLHSSGMFQSCIRRSEVASECPEVVSELVRDIFEFFDLFFQGKEIISMRKHYFWKKWRINNYYFWLMCDPSYQISICNQMVTSEIRE